VAHIGIFSLLDRVIIPVDHPVEVLGYALGYPEQFLMVELPVLNKHGQSDRRQVTNRHFIGRGVFEDLRAEVGRPDGAQVLLVALAVGRILVEHVRGAGLNLGFQDLFPQFAGHNGFPSLAFLFVAHVEFLEFLAMAGIEARAFVGAHQGPFPVCFHPFHEQVGQPHGIEQVAGPHFFFAVVLF